MKRTFIFLLAFALAGSIFGQTPPAEQTTPPATPPDVGATEPGTTGEIDFGLQGVNVDTDSSEFEEYRDLRQGFVLPALKFTSRDFDFIASNALQKDQHYYVWLGHGPLSATVDFQGIPHNLGNDGRSILTQTSRTTWALSDTVQQANQAALEQQFATNRNAINFGFLRNLIAPTLSAQPSDIDLGYQRNRGLLELRYAPENDAGPSPYDIRLTYFDEERDGNRPYGTSFGFGNAVETAIPTDYSTRDLGARGEMNLGAKGLLRAGFNVNDFENHFSSMTFDNPFRATDSTDPNAYTGPASGSIGGPRMGRVSLQPDNRAVTGMVGLTYRLPANSTLSADVSLSRWTQDEQFTPYTTNTAITVPFNASDPSTLPEQSLNGKANITSARLDFVSRPIRNLELTARYNTYDFNNDTPRIEFPGYVRFDAVWEDIARINVPYGYRTNRGDLIANYDFGPVSIEGAVRRVEWNYTFREVDKTTENVGRLALDVRAVSWALVRVSYEKGSRSYDQYDIDRSESASFVDPEAGVNPVGLHRFDLANRDIDNLVAMLQLTPIESLSFSLDYTMQKENYKDSPFGLQDANRNALSAEVDYSPLERLNLFAYAEAERNKTFQIGRQSGATPSTNPADDWQSSIRNDTNAFGLGGSYDFVPDKLKLTMTGRVEKTNGNNDLFSPPGGTPDAAFGPIVWWDDTDLWTLSAEASYALAKAWRVAVGGWIEDYNFKDAATTGLLNYEPGAFFLAPDRGPYHGSVAYVRAMFKF